MFFRNILCALLLLTFFQTAFAQTTEKEKPKTVDDALRKEAVGFLRETSAEVGTLRSLENRISFASEMAGLMWFYDEKEAAAMYQTVITDFKQLLTDYDAQMNAMNLMPNESEYRASLFSGNQDDKTRLTQKFYKAIGVRQQIALSLAEHDAVLAFNFYYDTLSIISNAELRKTIEQRDASFESQFIKQIALKDAAKAVELGRKSLARGVNWTQVELLQKIYEKDNSKGAEFADAIVSKFKDDKVSASNLYNVTSFLSLGSENAEKVKKEIGKKPMFSEQNLRDLAEILAQGMLDSKQPREYETVAYAATNIELIAKYAPARAVQLRAKYPLKAKPDAALNDEPQVLRAPPLARNDAEIPSSKEVEVENKAQKEEA